MKNFTEVKSTALELFSMASFLGHISTEEEYHQALELMEELIEEYDLYKPLIEVLSHSIEIWEDEADEFAQFNASINSLDSGAATLRTLMDQYQLKADDLKDVIGGKSLVSMVLNGSRQLTKDHIQAISDKFNVSPALFFTRA
ncbi:MULTISPECIES: helix-turn-helix domain-containing protein [Vibrio]|uniref:Transcriptional regulator n=1 Tax=Vibrio genomosp. F6 str. FF-238 TaxID=1191298 RepID=A0A1E5CUK5_9VIBR|nr:MULTISPECIES: helix-turn-helix domain-containing protein [Vibrio]MDN3699204.1 helix-turn-helix domain-containing protein [Vibrio cortegadensis]OEE73583.1 transcriptional regulator [Vibrio genomosp. F6 str. FF-238]TKF14134.1 helix-turn-helix domain-containing protein [Vibrio genomosp. F6]